MVAVTCGTPRPKTPRVVQAAGADADQRPAMPASMSSTATS